MSLARRFRDVALSLVTTAVVGCSASSTDSAAPSPTAAVTPPVGPASVVADPLGRPTTDGAIALQNLDADITARRELVARRPDDIAARRSLASALSTRTQFVGSFDDFEELFRLADESIAIDGSDRAAHLLRASALGATHRFSEATAELDRAEMLGAKTAAERGTIAIAIGNADAATTFGDQAAASGLDVHALRAAIHAQRGQFEQADAELRASLEGYRDVSPFPVAFVAFQRGVMWGESADRPDLARPLYEEAVRRLPGYVVANVHLAELEAAQGEVDRALDRLARIRPTTADPEPGSRLSELLHGRDLARATDLTVETRTRYEALLARHPLAFADHAAEFFMGSGADPARALELARMNLDLRKTDRAYLLAIEASVSAGQNDLACSLTREAGDARTNVALVALRHDVLQRCGAR